MEQSAESEVKSSGDQGESNTGESMEEELDGLPVFGTDEDDWDVGGGFAQKALSMLDGEANEKSDAAEDDSSSAVEEMDAERAKDSEDTRITPTSDTIDVQDEQSELRIVSSRSESTMQANVPSEVTEKETDNSSVIHIKDEPIDEEYDKALNLQSDVSDIKQEMDVSDNNETEASAASDQLRISSVFSVSGNGSDGVSAPVVPSQPPPFSMIAQNASSLRGATLVLQAQPQTTLQLQLQQKPQMLSQIQTHPRMQHPMISAAHLQAVPQPPQIHAPPPAVRICCSGCSKVLQKGQTAFQRKGSNQLFCSTVCLTSFSLPSVQFTPLMAPKKTCCLCLKAIVNLKDLITIPVGSMNVPKEFCSQACLSIYEDRYEGSPPEHLTPCSMCKMVKEIQHEVNHLGSVHKLCSDDCFARFRSSRNLYMSYCENCGNCKASGNYHLVQLEDTIKKFCCIECIATYKQKSGKRLHCPCCQDVKTIDQMMEGTNIQGVTEFFCTQRCVALSQASPSLTGTAFPCTTCKNVVVPQYHLAISDGSIRNFCSLDCVGSFQDKLNSGVPHSQTNGNSPLPPPQNALPPQQTDSLQPAQISSNMSAQIPNPPPPPYAPPATQTPGMVNSQDSQQLRPKKPSMVNEIKRLICRQCQNQINTKPELFQFKGLTGLFCSRVCCDLFKIDNNVTAFCEYCKADKVVNDFIMFEGKPRPFCCEGCKLLFKDDLSKKFGGQCRVCAYCQNMTQKSIQNFFGGKLEEFCTEECMSLYTVLFYEMGKCNGCKNQGSLKESIVWEGAKRHFCNLPCLLQFSLKFIAPHQPMSNGTSLGTVPETPTVQAPLTLSKDMPIIGGMVSLVSTLTGNTALTGALPTSNASSKNIGEASTQTDAAMGGTPNRRMLKNKALMCRPITVEQAIQCQPETPKPSTLPSEKVVNENGEIVKLVPVPVPIPMPVYIPVPMHLYTQYTPFPMGLPLPVPVPMLIPGSQDAPEHKDNKCSQPEQSSVEEEERDKGKDKPALHDQGSTYSGDLESEVRSTSFNLADTEDPAASAKLSVPAFEAEELPPTGEEDMSSLNDQPDLENDFPRTSPNLTSAKENRLVLTLKRRKKGRDGHSPRKRCRKRSGPDTSSSIWQTTTSSKLNQTYGVQAWASWARMRTRRTDPDPEPAGGMTFKGDVLECSSTDLSYGLCHFVKEVRRPNGQPYDPDSIYYLCLGIQQYLLENERLENIFTDPLYNQFIADITLLLKNWGNTFPPGGYMLSRVEEEFLWECKQLGALSPIVLLNTLLFFTSKLLKLKTVEEHQRLAFSNVSLSTRTTKNGKTSYLLFRLPKEDEREKKYLRRKKEEETKDGDLLEMPENVENPLRCPVRLYEFYLSKCSNSVKQRPDLFYLQPDMSCHPSSSMWYSAKPLDRTMMESMLARILAIRDVHLDSRHQQKTQDSSDEESS